MKKTILIVEDDDSIAEFLRQTLEREGFTVLHAPDGREAVRLFPGADAILLDQRLPRMSGLEVLREVRRTSQVPVLIVSVKGHESDKVAGLELGADDYITKPFSARELVARLRANLRKGEAAENRTRLGDVEIDWARADVFRSGMRIVLTSREFGLLQALHEARERVLAREWLLERIWGYDFEGDDRVVDTTIKRLRAKVGADLIETVRGLGYRLAR
ncbi:response regulator transcription factor [bacterium]|nr:response regulator transcription factor [bacterium]